MKTASKAELYRQLPSVDDLLRSEHVARLIEREGRTAVTSALRTVLEHLREEITAGTLDASRLPAALEHAGVAVENQLRRDLGFSLRRVINATGVILHTNLGRAPLGEAAVDHLREIATGYSNLEFDIEAGERGKRDVHVQKLLAKLFADSAEYPVSTVVVNNNAAAVLLALNSLAEGGEVVVSRGELVEIGGSFRIPDVMSKSGAVLREVGTTNRTRVDDYERAINERTRLLLRVHRSNFEIVGFTEQPSLEELVALGRRHDIPVIEDLGSGALIDLNQVGIRGEPNVFDSLRAGVDLVTYSGDKLLGGPQAGLLSGRPELVAKIRSNPLFRALRVDKLSYSVLESVLLAYVKHDHDAIPALRMLRAPVAELERRARELCAALSQRSDGIRCEVVETRSIIGGGAAPGSTLPSFAVAVEDQGRSAEELSAALRQNERPIIARVEDDRVLLDLRTVFAEDEAEIVAALAGVATR